MVYWPDLTVCAEVDPYAFDDDFDKDATLNSSSGGDFGRFGPVSAGSGGKSNLVTNNSAASPAGSTGSSAYKFKSALLSREQVSSTPSPEPPTFQRDPNKVLPPLVAFNAKSVPLRFADSMLEADFADECARFIDDLADKNHSVSTKPSGNNANSHFNS